MLNPAYPTCEGLRTALESRLAVGQPTCDYIAKTAPRRQDEQAVDFQYNQLWALPLHYLQIQRESVLSFHT